jgi:hypothetical protein
MDHSGGEVAERALSAGPTGALFVCHGGSLIG